MPSNFKALAGASGGEPNDPNFKNVTLLLHGDGSNGAQNNTFLDSSTNNFTITRNGNTTQGSFSPYGSNWSNYFDGSGDYLTSPTTSALGFGTGDFTIELWFFTPAFSAIQALIDLRSSAIAEPLALSISSTGLARSYDLTVRTGGQCNANQWNHIAWVRASGVNTVYVNGVSGHSWTNGADYGSTRPAWIGMSAGGGSEPFTGYISNIRVLKGTALYTSTFTPPTQPLTAITNTSLLTCADNRFRDGSTNNFTITRNGDVRVTNFAPFAPSSAYSTTTNGGSAYFDGTGDYLTVPDNAALEPGSSNLTWEMWINTNTTNSTQYATFYSRMPATFATGMWSLMMNLASSTAGDVGLYVADYTTASPLLQTTGVDVRDGAWHHIAVVRNGSAWVLYVDGVSRATATWAGTIADIAGGPSIGRDEFYTRTYLGYISNLRIVKGTAVYTTNFTPPSSPVTAITNTSLLLNATNAAIFDNSMKNNLETVGNAQISTSVKKFGTGSMYFDGNGDYLASRMSSDLVTFGNGDFTIEMWIYFNDVTTLQCFYDQRPSGTQGAYPAIYVESGTLRFNSNTTDLITTSVSTGQWYHIAVTRSGNTTRLFKDGVSAGTYGTLINYLNGGDGRPGIGGGGFSTSTFFLNGYIDDLRITKGVARYTANFTPPTAPFPNK